MTLTPGRTRTRAVTLTGTYPRPDGFRPQSGGHEVAEAPGVSLHHVSALEGNGAVEYRPARDEGMKLSILAARVDGGGKIREQGVVECPARV